jgi:hypothetical protein
MADPLLDRFDDLTEPEKDYPGRTRPKLRRVRTVPEPPPTEWDDGPVYYMVGGERQEFFTIRHLAKALDYSQQSIRAWENQGLLPKSPYRSPKPRRPTIAGRNTKGKRLWTREQIDGILRIAREEGVIVNKKPPTRSFARKVAARFRSLVA